MQFVFIDMTGKTIFIRDDAERAEWTVEEMSLTCDFPFIKSKEISTGQRIFFKDPSTGAHQIYEVKQVRTLEPDSYQQVTAENICISELSDEHIDKKEITDESCSSALAGLLDGTLWTVGTHSFDPVSSVDISRGSVWQGVLQIKDNFNVYIEPRVTLATDGTITRKLDILSTDGTWRGVRLSVDKNVADPSVTLDDSETYTALYGYGGTITDAKEDEDQEVNISSVVWEQTDEHPAKPEGQNYIEDPAATAEFGRDGRPRFGFYQNSDIDDPELLLEKTWETLKTVCAPDISFEGTVTDLYRLGYADQPLRLHDIALVEILPIGFKKQAQIIRMTVDLLDPSATTLTIGSYIPNIIYISRETNENATGSRGGGGKNTGDETTWREFRTTMEAYQDGTGMRIRAVRNDLDQTNEEVARQSAEIEVTYSMIRQEVKDRIGADNEISSNITQTASQIRMEVNEAKSQINSSITQTASQIRMEVNNAISGVNSSITQTASQIRSEVNAAKSDFNSSITQTANQIRSEVNNAISGVSSSITQTANQIRSEVNAAKSEFTSSITQTANQIRSEVTNAISGVNSSITQTANQIRSEVNAAKSDFTSSITQTANQIRTEVTNAVSGLNSSITQTANQIRSEVTNAVSGLQSSITQNANDISLVVTDGSVYAASIVAAINEAGSSVVIDADHIELLGSTIASKINGESISMNSISCQSLSAITASFSSTVTMTEGLFTYGSNTVSWQSTTIPTITYSNRYNFVYKSNGVEYTSLGYIVGSHGTKTIYYLGRANE